MSTSIILSTYDNVEYIDRCITSLQCSYANYDHEILIGIDGCKRTKKWLKSINYKNLKIYYSATNVGPYIIKNSLLDKVRKDYILFFDTDDEAYENMGDMLSSDNSRYTRFVFDQVSFNRNKIKNKYTSGKVAEGVFYISKALMDRKGFMPWRCAADTEFINRLEGQGIEYKAIRQPLFMRRVHDKSLTVAASTSYKSPQRLEYMNIINNRAQSKNYNDPINITTELDLIYEN